MVLSLNRMFIPEFDHFLAGNELLHYSNTFKVEMDQKLFWELFWELFSANCFLGIFDGSEFEVA